VICSVVVGELIYGTERAAAAHRANNRLRVEQLRQQFVSMPFDDLASEEYGKVRAPQPLSPEYKGERRTCPYETGDRLRRRHFRLIACSNSFERMSSPHESQCCHSASATTTVLPEMFGGSSI
jgi:hypothetical protein